MLHKIPCFRSTRPFQIQANSEIFDALIRKLMYRLFECCRHSEHSLATTLIYSFNFCSKYAYYRDILTLDNG